jgi:hypothetical protein
VRRWWRWSPGRLIAHDPGTFAHAGGTSLSIDTRSNIPLVEATLETREEVRVRARLVVDLGSSSLALRLAASFVEKHSAAFAGLHGIDAPIGLGVGGRLMGRVVRLRSLASGELTIAAPIAGLAREKKGALEVGLFDGIVGAPVLRPWIAVDYPGSRLFLHADAGRSSSYDASGLTLTSDAGIIRVDFVAAPSPAAEAGLQPGDAIHRLDGRPVSARDLGKLRGALREAGATPILDIGRLGSVPLPLRTLV